MIYLDLDPGLSHTFSLFCFVLSLLGGLPEMLALRIIEPAKDFIFTFHFYCLLIVHILVTLLLCFAIDLMAFPSNTKHDIIIFF